MSTRQATIMRLMVACALLTAVQMTAGNTNLQHRTKLLHKTADGGLGPLVVSNNAPMARSVLAKIFGGTGPELQVRTLSEGQSDGSLSKVAVSEEDMSGSSTLFAELVSSGSGEKQLIWDPVNDWQRITYNCEVDLEFDVVYNTQRGDIYQYVIVELRGTVHFWGTAEDKYYGSYNTLNFDDTRSYTIVNPPGGLLEYSASKQRVTYAQSSLGSGTGDVVPYYIQFFGLAHSYSARLWVDLPSGWYFDDEYDNCNPGMGVDLTDTVILSPRANVTKDANFQYNSAYPGNWRMVDLGAYVQADFELDNVPGSANLVIDHLSAASEGCPGGGYSPVDIIVNGNIVESCYDPAENHGGTHSFVTDNWDISSYLQTGSNSIRIALCDNFCTHYWIRYLYIEDLGDDCATCDLEMIRVTEISVRENVPIKDVPNIIWTESEPDVFHPVADGEYEVEGPEASMSMSSSSASGNPKPLYYTMPGIKYSIKVDIPQGITTYHKCEIEWKILETNGTLIEIGAPKPLTSTEKDFVIRANKKLKIGQYKLQLKFSFKDNVGNLIGSDQPPEHDLYVIYADIPKNTFPGGVKESYLIKATEFAKGATASDANDILVTTMNSFRNQGWEYSQDLSGSSKAVNGADLLFNGKQYGSCESFAQAMKIIADVHGIHTELVEQKGNGGFPGQSDGLGFLTKTNLLTIDGKPGGARPGEWPSSYDRWYFAYHVLVKHHHNNNGSFSEYFYDPTFTEYDVDDDRFFIEDDTIWISKVLNQDVLEIQYLTSTGYRIKPLFWETLIGHYQKHQYTSPSAAVQELQPDLSSVLIASPTAGFSGTHSAYGVDADSDGVYNALAIDVQVDGIAGEYYIIGLLRSGDNIISIRSSSTSQAFSNASVQLSGAEPNATTIFFSGEDIFQRGFDGAYTAEVYLTDANSVLMDDANFVTPSFSHLSFGEEPVRLIGISDGGIDDDEDSMFDWLSVEIELDIIQPNEYYAVAFLSEGPNSPTFMSENGGSDPCDSNSIVIMFDGRYIREIGMDGPYTLNVSLYDPNDNCVTAGEFTTGPYTANMFESPPAGFNGNCTDYIVNVDSACPMDMLVIDVEVEVNEPNIYEIGGWLIGSDANTIEIVTMEVDLGIGTTEISLEFDGKNIAENGIDGPYYLSYIAMRQQNAENNGYLTAAENIHETDAYLACEFDPDRYFASGDFNCSCVVDLEDLIILCSQWLQPPGDPSADIAPDPKDNFVNLLDFALLSQEWLLGP